MHYFLLFSDLSPFEFKVCNAQVLRRLVLEEMVRVWQAKAEILDNFLRRLAVIFQSAWIAPLWPIQRARAAVATECELLEDDQLVGAKGLRAIR